MPKQIPLAARQHRLDWAAWYTDKTLYEPSTLQPTNAAVELQWFASFKRRGVYVSADRKKTRHIVEPEVRSLALMTRERRDLQAGFQAALQLTSQMAGELLDAALDEYVRVAALAAATSVAAAEVAGPVTAADPADELELLLQPEPPPQPVPSSPQPEPPPPPQPEQQPPGPTRRVRARSSQHDTRAQQPVLLQSAPSPCGMFKWGELAPRARSVRDAIANGTPVVLRVSDIEGIARFDEELRASSTVWRSWVNGRPIIDKSESQLAQLDAHHTAGTAIWHGVCKTLGVCGDSPIGATIIGSLVSASGEFRTPLHWHAPPVCNIALGGCAEKDYLLIPFEVASDCGLAEGDNRLLNWDALLAALGPRAADCWTATIGAHIEHNCVLWPSRMLHLVVTRQPPQFDEERRHRCPAPLSLAGADEGPRRALYFGFGSYIFDPAHLDDLLNALVNSRGSRAWRQQFQGDASSMDDFESWYMRRAPARPSE